MQLAEKEKQEETLWRQKSRIRWLKDEEKNTKLFHSTTIQRRMHNNITHIQNEYGIKMEKHEEIETELLNFSSRCTESQIMTDLRPYRKLLAIFPKLSQESITKCFSSLFISKKWNSLYDN